VFKGLNTVRHQPALVLQLR